MNKHKWQFSSRFRRNAFGWRSQVPLQRIKEALSEIRAIARRDPLLAADGAVLSLRDREAKPSRVDRGSRRIFFAAEQVKKIYEAA